jgi:RimJ/RimL family protein N-acetyltransferase
VIPSVIRTANLHLRSWRQEDAATLLPVLEANVARLVGWIPQHVASPAPLPEMEARLAGFAEDFAAARACRFAILSADERQVYGEVDLFFRSAAGRVPLEAADRLEIGYWLRSEATGRGYATEAARAIMALGATLPGMRHIEIRCDPRNESSAAVPRRLGFMLLESPAAPPDGNADMVWIHELT